MTDDPAISNTKSVREFVLRELAWDETQLASIRDRGHRLAALSLTVMAGLYAALSFTTDGSPGRWSIGLAALSALLLLGAAAGGAVVQKPRDNERVSIETLRRYQTPESLTWKPADVMIKETEMLTRVLETTRTLRQAAATVLERSILAMIAGVLVGVIALTVGFWPR